MRQSRKGPALVLSRLLPAAQTIEQTRIQKQSAQECAGVTTKGQDSELYWSVAIFAD